MEAQKSLLIAYSSLGLFSKLVDGALDRKMVNKRLGNNKSVLWVTLSLIEIA